MTDETKKRLHDALMACRAISSFTEGLDFSDYEDEANLLVRSGVERQLEIVGEAVRRAEDADPELIERLPELRQIVGLRNRIIHGYDSVDDEIVWDVVQNKIPALTAQLTALLATEN
jgi:uncharacterized protein with HEPN domain